MATERTTREEAMSQREHLKIKRLQTKMSQAILKTAVCCPVVKQISTDDNAVS